jgi:hypothetical protein
MTFQFLYIDIEKRRILETLDAALYPGSPAGRISQQRCGIASEDEKTLYFPMQTQQLPGCI